MELTAANEFIAALEAHGFEAYAVGGCVRDSVLKRDWSDLDIATSADPEQVRGVFGAGRVFDTGAAFGTVTVFLAGVQAQITAFRSDGASSDRRHPSRVSFNAGLLEDASRRDFTINAMYYHPGRGIIDPMGGRADIEKRLIRAIGQPERRFNEDALRILRAVRFSSVLGFDIDPHTQSAMHSCAGLLSFVSAERKYKELCGLICGAGAGRAVMLFSDVLSGFIPELSQMRGFEQHSKYHIYDVLEHTASVIDCVEARPELRLAALFHDCAKPRCFTMDERGGHFYSHAALSAEIAKDVMLGALHADKATTDAVCSLVRLHHLPLPENEKILKRRLLRLTPEFLKMLLQLQRADCLSLAPQYRKRAEQCDRVLEIIERIQRQNECFTLGQLCINGNDLLALGLRGPSVGKALRLALDAVVDETAKNEKSALLSLIENAVRAGKI